MRSWRRTLQLSEQNTLEGLASLKPTAGRQVTPVLSDSEQQRLFSSCLCRWRFRLVSLVCLQSAAGRARPRAPSRQARVPPGSWQPS